MKKQRVEPSVTVHTCCCNGRCWCCFLPPYSQESRKLKLAFDAKRNGWKAAAFHKGVDFKGPGIVVAKTKGGAVAGGSVKTIRALREFGTSTKKSSR